MGKGSFGKLTVAKLAIELFGFFLNRRLITEITDIHPVALSFVDVSSYFT
jgi:hypothetical protein